jgi:hypothetical protein
LLGRLPQRRGESYKRVRAKVGRGSLIHVDRNTYSVDSRLIGERVAVRVYAEHLEVWYGQKLVERLPRLRGRNKHRINYRHVIEWLVRKPGAFENYRYREDLFPTSRFRMAYDALRESQAERADKEYLQILYLAAQQSESAVDEALRVLLAEDRPMTAQSVESLVGREEEIPAVTEVTVEEFDLSHFDDLFTGKEVWDGFQERCEGDVDGILASVAPADVSGEF